MSIDSQKLEVFRTVAREGGFSRAAARLRRTQPAVSQAIRLLEEEIGERLFLRLGRTIRLTQAGEILLESADEAFDTLDRARTRIEALRELREGRLRITTSDTTACYLLPPVLGEFHRRYPNVEVSILNRRSPEAVREVEAREADIGIITLPEEPLGPRLASEPLVVREDVAICSPNHPLARKRRRRAQFADLLAWPLLLLDHGSNTRSFIDRKIRESGGAPRIAMELGAIELVKRLVERDFGVSIVPAISIRDEIREKRLKSLRVFDRGECRALGLIYPARGALSLPAQEFVRVLKALLPQA
ncbi:LysR family transcriptional regulator [Candidatus Sumerlaeota bacterium]|nr:LysR family transcriptional regulator [Candidatus Sumerlaeota bacterium]